MDIDIYIQQYLRGSLEVDINSLSNEDKIHYEKQKQLLDNTLKWINEFLYNLHRLEKIREEMKKIKNVS